jgi:putative ABC transport system permease protein
MLGSLKIAFRVLIRHKFFTFISLFGICFTLVVLTVVTALLDATFGPMAPEKKIARTLGIYSAQLRGDQGRMTGLPGYALLDRYARDLPGAELMSISTGAQPAYSYPNGGRVEMNLKRTDGAFWQVFDFEFLEGAPFTAEDDARGNAVAVINDATRRRLFGGDAVGKSIDVDGQTFRVVGVVADVSILRLVPFSDVWVPLGTSKSDSYKRELVGNMMGVVVARDSSDFDAIRQELQSRLARADLSQYRGFTELEATPETLFEFGAAQVLGQQAERGNTTLLLALIGLAMLLFMLLPTINLTNLNVSRILERAPEIGVRKAFGASSGTLVGQFLVENVVITLAGGLLAFALSQVVLSALSSSGLIQYADLRVNYRVFLYGLGIATVFGLVSGVYPAWKMSRLDAVVALKGGVR